MGILVVGLINIEFLGLFVFLKKLRMLVFGLVLFLGCVVLKVGFWGVVVGCFVLVDGIIFMVEYSNYECIFDGSYGGSYNILRNDVMIYWIDK